MSRTIKHHARKVATKAAIDLFGRSTPGFASNIAPADWSSTWFNTYKAQFSGRRQRHQYAETRKAKANIELPVRPSHDDAGDTAGFTCLYG